MLDLLITIFNNNIYLINFILIFFGSLIITNFFTPYATILLISNVNNDFILTINLILVALGASFLASQITFVISEKIKKRITKDFKNNKTFVFAKESFLKHGKKIIGIMYFLGPVKAPFIFFYGITNKDSQFVYTNLLLSFIWAVTVCFQGKIVFFITQIFGDILIIKILVILLLTITANYLIYRKLNES